MKTNLIAGITALLLLSCSCGKTFDEVMELQREISERYDCEDVSVSYNSGRSIKVTLTNTRYNDSSSVVKQRLSGEIGVMVMKREHFRDVREGITEFVTADNYVVAKTMEGERYPMNLERAE